MYVPGPCRHGDTNVAFMLDKKMNLKRELAWFIPASSDEVGLALMPILILVAGWPSSAE